MNLFIFKNKIIFCCIFVFFLLLMAGVFASSTEAACPPSFSCPPYLSYVTPVNLVSCSQPCGTHTHSISCPGGTETFSVNYGSSCTSCPGSSGTSELTTYCCSSDSSKCTTVCKRGVSHTSSYTAQHCTRNGSCGNPLQCDPSTTWTGSEVCCNGDNTSTCYKGEIFTVSDSVDCYGTPPGGGSCSPSCPSRSTYCPGNEPSDGCGGTCPTGTKSPSCPDTSTYCPGNEPSDGCGGTCPTGTKPPSCPASSTYCPGSEPADGCGGACPAGTRSCTPPSVCGDGDCNGTEECFSCQQDCGSCPAPSIGSISVWNGNKIIRLALVSVADALSAAKGVVKVVMSDGSVGAAQFVETSDTDASAVRVRTTPRGTKAWRDLNVFAKEVIGLDSGKDIVRANDGGYVVVGSTGSYGAGGTDMYIAKFSGDGTIQWAKAVGGPGNDTGESVIRTSDNGYVAAGYSESFGPGNGGLFLVKFNSSGTLLWSRTVGSGSYESGSRETGKHVVESADGGFFVVGGSSSYGGTKERRGCGRNKILMTKFDSFGELIWAKTLGGPDNNYACSHESPWSVIRTLDNGYLISGLSGTRYSYNLVGTMGFIAKVNANADSLEWANDTSGHMGTSAYSNEGYAAVQSPDGSYLFLTIGDYWPWGGYHATQYPLVIKFNSSGVKQWMRSVALSGSEYDTAFDLIRASDGNGYVLVGAAGYSADGFHMVKIDSSGYFEWNYRFQEPGSRGYAVIQANDGGYVAVGCDVDCNDMLITKLGDNGQYCSGETVSFGQRSSGAAVVIVNPYIVERTLISVSPSPSVTNLALTSRNVCQ